MFYNKEDVDKQLEYINSLQIVGSLSNLFSESKAPYLYYRVSEKLFCTIFNANDLSRGDIAYDASKGNIGVGIKTFLRGNSKTLQKIAEFNKDRELYKDLNAEDIAREVSNLRNNRIEFANRLSGVNSTIYHCIVREEDKFLIFEEQMNLIDIEKISLVKQKNNTITFNDGISEYSFNLSKSTLYKRFLTTKFLEEFEVKIFENPLEELKNCYEKIESKKVSNPKIIDTIYMPLYGKNKVVFPKSGLNQWNAGGRRRDINEIYIPIPRKIHDIKPNFFPERDKSFNLHLPDGRRLNSKVCQDNSKALMSNPNEALGEWLLREVLSLKGKEILTYEKLQSIGIDSVRIDKIDSKNYYINFTQIDSYEEFIENFS